MEERNESRIEKVNGKLDLLSSVVNGKLDLLLRQEAQRGRSFKSAGP